jgi:hypothetical protein
VKIKLIQGMIQVQCPINWSLEKAIKFVNEIKWIEIYDAEKLNKVEVTRLKFDINT